MSASTHARPRWTLPLNGCIRARAVMAMSYPIPSTKFKETCPCCMNSSTKLVSSRVRSLHLFPPCALNVNPCFPAFQLHSPPILRRVTPSHGPLSLSVFTQRRRSSRPAPLAPPLPPADADPGAPKPVDAAVAPAPIPALGPQSLLDAFSFSIWLMLMFLACSACAGLLGAAPPMLETAEVHRSSNAPAPGLDAAGEVADGDAIELYDVLDM